MIHLSMEEFASKRRTSQTSLEDLLQPVVRRALASDKDTGGWAEVLETVRDLYKTAYRDESGQAAPALPKKFINKIHAALKKAKRPGDEATVDRLSASLATAILSMATITASQADEEELFMEWVDMGDRKVRHAHSEANGQQRPIGESFNVGGVLMPYPGYPVSDPALWVNCRCTLRPVPASEALVAAADAPLEEPTHAGVAVVALDTGRLLLIQRSMDPEDAPDVQGTWEFPGGTIEPGEGPEEAAWREFSEETGLPQPDGEMTNGWRSPDGVYQGYVFTVPVEAEAFDEINPDHEAAHMVNPDDPERRQPDVTAWFTIEQIKNLGPALRPEVAKTDWTLFDPQQEAPMPDTEPADGTYAARFATWAATVEPEDKKAPPELQPEDTGPGVDEPPVEPVNDAGGKPAASPDEAVPWHAVLAVEGKKTGDGRRFLPNSLSNRPLPLPFTWQEVAAEGHDGNVVVAKIEKLKMARDVGEQRASGHFINSQKADEFIGMLGEFGKFGVSIDADSAVGGINEAEEVMDFSEARTSGACAVAIPALHEAWIALGEPPAEWEMDAPDEEVEPEGLVAAAIVLDSFKDLAPGKTEDGPGWLTDPIPTDRLRDYWVHGEGGAQVGWGTPGDFNRCRALVAQYIQPQHLAGYCANRHYDALGFWPGRPVAGDTTPFAHETLGLTDTEMASSMTLTASAGHVAPAAWFSMAEPELGDPLLVQNQNGGWSVPFTVTKEGQVFGHLAAKGTCHISPQFDYCQEPPESTTEYAGFRTGAVLLDNDELAATGPISIGGGHAGPRMSARQALAHYDNTSTAVADVIPSDGQFGIWCCGWVRPGVSDDMVTALRASAISGDWRPWGNHPLELVAALAVNVPGFGVPRVQIAAANGKQLSLVAAGVVAPAEEVAEQSKDLDIDALGYRIATELAGFAARREELAALAAGRAGRGA